MDVVSLFAYFYVELAIDMPKAIVFSKTWLKMMTAKFQKKETLCTYMENTGTDWLHHYIKLVFKIIFLITIITKSYFEFDFAHKVKINYECEYKCIIIQESKSKL